MQYTPQGTIFAVHAQADVLRLRLVHPGTRTLRVVELGPTYEPEVFSARVEGDLRGWTYSYEIRRGDRTLSDIIDPWATLVREERGVIEAEDTRVHPRPALNPEDATIYELHIRDFTNDPSSGVRPEWRGRYLGLTERATHLAGTTISTAIDHILELGANVVQLMPVHAFSMPNHPSYEWGYMPNDYNAPHVGYTSAVDVEAPIREFKQLVSTMHDAGLRVTLDVVYNHTAERWPDRLRSLMALAPRSYFRFTPEGRPWDGSACGNEFKSESPHGRRFLRESCRYWVERYGIDGFRFDLMGLIDQETMALVAQDLHAVDPTILLYGEPWAAGPTPIEVNGRGKQRGRGWAVFNDRFRDGLRGDVFDLNDPGFLNTGGDALAVKRGIRGGIDDFADAPTESINYIEAHDNHTLFDRLDGAARRRESALPAADRSAMSTLGAIMLMTSQGIPFLHCGQEFGRSKGGSDNSYNLGDAVNNVQWTLKADYLPLFEQYRAAVRLRRAHPMFRLHDAALVRKAIRFLDDDLKMSVPTGVIAYVLDDVTGGDSWARAVLAFNGGWSAQSLPLPPGHWRAAVRDNAFLDTLEQVDGAAIALAPHSATILFEPR